LGGKLKSSNTSKRDHRWGETEAETDRGDFMEYQRGGMVKEDSKTAKASNEQGVEGGN
jgi:hypothetical protein